MKNRSSIRNFFENNWETMVLWSVLIGLFYLLRSFFLLFFLTFLITFITKGIVHKCTNKFRLNHRLTTALVFILFVSLFVTVGAWVGPKLIVESNKVLTDLTGAGKQENFETVEQFMDQAIAGVVGEEKAQDFMKTKEYAAMMQVLKDEVGQAVKAIFPHVLSTIVTLAKLGWKVFFFLFFSIFLSFILVMDWQKIVAKMKELETSRIRTFYLGAMPHLVAFTDVLGKALRAQVIIAICNTVLTTVGLWFFNVPNITLLATIVFFCGFIPILGTFISSVPILLFGIQIGGLPLMMKLIALVVVVHAFEAYVLNPKITGSILHIHPVLVLILLLLGERFFGIWGLIVGVPIGYYLITVLMQKDESIAYESQSQDKRVEKQPG
ncbi:AI-2E family transporter [Verrucomicrobiota bacterium]